MQLTTTLLTALLSATALAAPAVPDWTIVGMKRTCNKADTSCTWSFKIDTHLAAPTPCSFTVTGNPASHTNANGKQCGPYQVGAGWDGSFGPGQGFTVLSVVDHQKKLIVWPGYTDKELGTTGQVVSPDKSYAPASIA
ncbi:hypothetical protein DL766_001017 [Monosporascus sp. MC13-8B]|uniref:Small secreted protein n=1 Tax=Monosporascus cannonballus TaxID=155416 RepID=A0ABY0H6Q8_9PEZI|nr:hypothetical protein DL763_010661 [Monosporascus cannonballus]RYO86360.1 hypothetical protein DL762_004776 [Monosporascus cannonballus]RYP38308.1 hypothetical protein DL766_001017 [Monosporascus sp. MC13-8B]